MRNKKLVSTVLATALAASTMVMPVMAESGHVDVDLETKTAVIRVAVPTSLAAAVNPLEVGDSGSQIYSDDFKIENKSETPVKVDIVSTATIKSGNKLLATKAAATSSTTAGEAWLAVAAQTSDGKYIEDTTKSIADLTDTSANVTTFVNKGTEAAPEFKTEQTFYLDKSGTMAYKMLNVGEDADAVGNYVEFHELTAVTITGADDPAKQTALNALLAKGDVYFATAAAANGQTLTKIAKGGSHTYSATDVYYTASATAVAGSAVDGAKLYLYSDTSTATAATGKAAFRYLGQLSEKQDTWTKDDISKIVVSYTIGGVKESKYSDLTTKNALTYGLYKDPSYVSSTTMTATNNSVTLSLPSGVTLTKVEATLADGTGAVTLNDSIYSLEGTTFSIVASNITNWAGMSPAYTKVVLTFSDNKTETITLQ